MFDRFLYDNLILSYHRIVDNKNQINSEINSISVTTETFEGQIKLLKKKFNIVSIDEILKIDNRFENNLAITFDDGYKDNLTHAVPILEKYNVPATIYITTRFLENKLDMWWYEIEKIIWQKDKLDFYFLDKKYYFDIKEENNKKNCYKKLSLLFKSLSYLDQNKLLEQITKTKERIQFRDKILNKSDLIQLDQKKNITIGSHTHTHANLAILNDYECKKELLLSKQILENILNKKIAHFAFPYGSKKDAGFREANLVRDAGYQSAVTTQSGGKINSNLYLIPRVHIGENHDGWKLLIKLTWLYKIYYYIRFNFFNTKIFF